MSRTSKELKKFLVAGCSAVGTDMGSYFLLLEFFPHSVSKGVSFLLGTIVAYFFNKYWTFEKQEKSLTEIARFGMLYSMTLGANVMTNKATLMVSGNMILFSFLVATSVSTVLNFVGQKWWVFR